MLTVYTYYYDQCSRWSTSSQVHGECRSSRLWFCSWWCCCSWRRLPILALARIFIKLIFDVIGQRGHGLEPCPSCCPFASRQNGPRRSWTFSSGWRGSGGSVGPALPLPVHEHRCVGWRKDRHALSQCSEGTEREGLGPSGGVPTPVSTTPKLKPKMTPDASSSSPVVSASASSPAIAPGWDLVVVRIDRSEGSSL